MLRTRLLEDNTTDVLDFYEWDIMLFHFTNGIKSVDMVETIIMYLYLVLKETGKILCKVSEKMEEVKFTKIEKRRNRKRSCWRQKNRNWKKKTIWLKQKKRKKNIKR